MYIWYTNSKGNQPIYIIMASKFISFVLFIFLAFTGISQNLDSFFKVPIQNTNELPYWAQLMYSENPNVDAVSDAFDDYYASEKFVKNTHTQNYKFWLKSIEEYINLEGFIEIPESSQWLQRQNQFKTNKINQAKNPNTWSCIGPFETYKNNGSLNTRPTQTNVSSLAVAPSNTDILFCGANSGGGVFKSIDHGLNWALVTLNEPIGNAIDIKIHPLNPDIVYISDGAKIFKTVDGGSTWDLIFTASGTVEQFYIHRTQPNIVFAATASGLLKSEDNGTSWTNVFNERCWDIEAHVIDPNILFLSISNSAQKRAEIYKSLDNGGSWNLMDNDWYVPTVLAEAVDQGCKIGLTPADPDRVYAGLIGASKDGDNGWIGIYYSLDGGNSWVNSDGIDGGPYVSGNDMNTNWFVAGYSSGYHQGWYNFDLDISHVDPDRLWVGTIWACESANRGANIEYIRGTRNLEMHADIQDIDVIGNEIWYTSDGGINYSTDEMQTVEIRQNGISASTYWGFSQGWNEDTWTGGRYHNGDAVYHENFGLGNTMFLGGAETSTGYINPLNNRITHFSDIGDKLIPDALYLSSTGIPNLSLYPNEAFTTLNSSEIEYHPSYSNYMYLGKDNIFYKSINGGKSFEELFIFNASARVLEFEISRQNPDVIYCLVRENSIGTIYKSSDGGSSFSALSAIPSNNLSRLDLSLNPANSNELWVCSHNAANGQKVYRTIDSGLSWENMTTNALDGHKLYDILYQAGTDDLVYLASNYAVFYWDNSLNNWTMYSDGLPFLTRALRFKAFYRDSKLRLSSSRGVWEAPFATLSQAQAEPMTESKTVYCSRDTIQFEDYSFLDHTNATWQWSISPCPDYISSNTVRNPKVVFGEEGSYSVTLTVTDNLGNTSTKTKDQMVELIDLCAPDPIPGLALNCSSAPDHAIIPNLEISQTNSLTISAWVKPNGEQPIYTGIVMNDGDAAGLNFKNSNQLAYHWPGGSWSWNSGLFIPENEWSHVAIVVSPNAVKVYLNGIESVHNTSPSPVDIEQMRIGSYKGWTSRNYNGQIDEVCIWDTSLSKEEIRELRHLTRTGDNPYSQNLIAYYQFNVDDGSNQILDKVASKHASLNGSAEKIVSTAPFGDGQSHRLEINAAGNYSFGDTEVDIDFGNNHPNGEVVVTRLNLLPDSLPNSNPTAGNYWIINNYGSSNFVNVNELSLKPSSGVAFGNPVEANLFQRLENEDLNNWALKCTADNFSAGNYNYSENCDLQSLSQFFIQSSSSNPIQNNFIELSSSIEICANDSMFLENAFQNTAGIYVDTVFVSQGTDSIIFTTLSILPIHSQEETISLCYGDDHTFPDGYTLEDIQSSVSHTSFFQSVAGCDSLIISSIEITIIDISTSSDIGILYSNQENGSYQWLNCSNAYSELTGEFSSSIDVISSGTYAIEIEYNGCIDTSECVEFLEYFPDFDSDDFGDNSANGIFSASPINGMLNNNSDCNDLDETINPNAVEICDDIDNDCNGLIDDNLIYTTYFLDNDSDGFGDPNQSLLSCIQPMGYVTDNSDCNDSDPNSFPLNDEICDGIDNNCNGQIDENLEQIFYADADGDGFGDINESILSCTMPIGFVENNEDCNDLEPLIFPNAEEICGDELDNNCNGIVDEGCGDCFPGSVLAPNSLQNQLGSNGYNLTWEPIINSVACQINGGLISGNQVNLNIIQNEPSNRLVPLSILNPGSTYKWRIRCACQLNPSIIAGPFSEYNYFTVPIPQSSNSSSDSDILDSKISLLPNPASEYVRIYSSSGKITVYSILGKHIISIDKNEDVFHLDTSSWSSGIYILNFESNNAKNLIVKKFIIE